MQAMTTAPRRQTLDRHPGSMEMIDITTWTRKGTGWIRAKGHYDVYCGMGAEHRVALNVTEALDYYERAGVETLDEAGDQLVADWLAYDYTGCDCDTEVV